ncbi:PepSY-associated TM helix domain-containing protein [Parasphingorhabdus sp.]|uniref:PepSY-associated TM helix domain-containing protein n=1 Tax=Parasphingorhabdus sp. TaxID=2709688 RepID=UPI0030018BDF
MRVRGDRLRGAVRTVHLWLGLTIGGLLALLGLTGSVLVFYPEIDTLLHPEIQVAGPQHPGAAPDWDRALATVRAAYPGKSGPWRFEVTGEPGAVPARYYDPPERAGHGFRPMMVWLAPDGSRVLRRDYWGEYAMTLVYDLHYRLLLGTTGGQILGWLGFAMLALLLSGLWAWWPRGSWGKALRLKLRGHPQRRLRDWHKLTGLSGGLLLVILTVTGIMLELPEESDAALAAAGLPVDPMPHVHRPPEPSGPPRPIAQILAAGRAALPGARLAWIETPPAGGGMFRLRMQVAGDPSHRFPHSYVWVDSASGRVLAVHDAQAARSGSVVNNWIHPLHEGSAGGLAGRILVAICGLLPTLLLVTGLLRWRGRRGRLGAAGF